MSNTDGDVVVVSLLAVHVSDQVQLTVLAIRGAPHIEDSYTFTEDGNQCAAYLIVFTCVTYLDCDTKIIDYFKLHLMW